MTRIACALVLVALGLLVVMLFRTDGQTAIAFTFVGAPALAVGIGVHLHAAQRGRRAERRRSGESID